MPCGEGPLLTSAERRKEINGQAEGGGGEGQIAVTACHAAGGAFGMQRRFNAVETGEESEDFTADGATTRSGVVEGAGGG